MTATASDRARAPSARARSSPSRPSRCTERERFSPITVANRQVPCTAVRTPIHAESRFKKASNGSQGADVHKAASTPTRGSLESEVLRMGEHSGTWPVCHRIVMIFQS